MCSLPDMSCFIGKLHELNLPITNTVFGLLLTSYYLFHDNKKLRIITAHGVSSLGDHILVSFYQLTR